MGPVENLLILGGYGRVGSEIAKLLLKHSSCNIWLTGRDPIKASWAARELNSRCFEKRVTGIEVNAYLKVQLVRLFKKVDLVINAIPNTGPGGKIVQAALEAGIDYIDLSAGGVDRDALYQVGDNVREAGLTFITKAGFVSGVPSTMARYISGQFESVDKVTVEEMNDPACKKELLTWLPGGNKGRLARPPEICSVKVSGTGISGDRSKRLTLTVGHRDASLAAAIAPIPCILGLVEGFISQPGIHLMGQILDPDRYLENLWDMGMTVSLQTLTEPKQMESRSGEMPLLRSNELPVF